MNKYHYFIRIDIGKLSFIISIYNSKEIKEFENNEDGGTYLLTKCQSKINSIKPHFGAFCANIFYLVELFLIQYNEGSPQLEGFHAGYEHQYQIHLLVPGRHRQVAGGGRLRLRRPHQHRGVQAQHRGQLPRGRAGRDMRNDKQVPKKM